MFFNTVIIVAKAIQDKENSKKHKKHQEQAQNLFKLAVHAKKNKANDVFI